MAAAVVTTNVPSLSSMTDFGYQFRGTATISASPATYSAGGIAMNLNQAAIKAQRTPLYVYINAGTNGYIYEFIRGTDNSNGKLKIYVQDAVAQNPLIELTDATTIPAAISGDTLHIWATYRGME